MQKLENVYVIDKLENIGEYAAINSAFAKAVALIEKGEFDKLVPGKNDIDGENAWVNNVEADLVNPQDRRPELHKVYFDIHVPLAGDEVMGLAKFDESAAGSFNEKDDIGFYEQPVEWLTIHKGEFAITWPKTCAHAPACTNEVPHKSRKLIFKVKA